MRRADRLFRVVQSLRRRKVTTAQRLAEELEVSERTVYRDVADLMKSGVPITGEAGIGYSLARGFDLPPMMFTGEELEALALGARLVQTWADPELAAAARSALVRIEDAVPERLRGRLDEAPVFAPGVHVKADVTQHLGELRAAAKARRKVLLTYCDVDGAQTQRTVRPLGLFFWGKNWTVAGWCELRDGFRGFRLDRIAAMEVTQEQFEVIPGRTLRDFLTWAQRRPAPSPQT